MCFRIPPGNAYLCHMKFLHLFAIPCVSCALTLGAEEMPPEMTRARFTGRMVAQMMHGTLTDRDAESFPGLHAWLAGEAAVLPPLPKDKVDDSWLSLDCEKLVRHNANFWQMFYEVVPADPGLAMIHAGMLMAAGDADRAQVILRLTMHRGDMADDARRAFIGIMRDCIASAEPSHALVKKGITLHDAGDFDGALAQYDAALRLWPRNGWAAYERGTTFLIVDKLSSDRTKKAFAQARDLQPFQVRAWQGTRAEIPGMMEMLTESSEIWEPSLKDVSYVMPPEKLLRLSEILQLAEVDDLALIVRQVYVVRRGRYMPEDHPFIAKSLRRLVPGPQAETTLTKLSGPGLKLTQMFKAPVPGQVKEQ